jgi:lipoprotein-anchoring transpeptidase ErfK/SrfK
VVAAAPAPRAFVPAATHARPQPSGWLTARILRPVELRATPGGRVVARLRTRTEFGSAKILGVRARRGAWLQVLAPERPNGRDGWIPATAVRLGSTDVAIYVDRSARRLTLRRGKRVLARFPVAVGRPGTPTPLGRFAVTDRLRTSDPSGPYGCCVLALSATSPHAIQGWSGGNRIAIHSTPETDSIGRPVSHGCIRVTMTEGRWLMAHIPLGTPVVISP